MMREELERAYTQVLNTAHIKPRNTASVNNIIRKALSDFTKNCRRPAIWPYGVHTRMLITDYIFEMKTVKYLIDEFRAQDVGGGFTLLRSSEIENYQIDGIIVSSFRYRDEITTTIKTKFPQIKYLDLYQCLQEHGIHLDCEYYSIEHPCVRYRNINRLKLELEGQTERNAKKKLQNELITDLIQMKDFLTAIAFLNMWQEEDGNKQNQELLEALERVYRLELRAASLVSEKNVLMLCVDGLLRKDLCAEQMQKLKRYIDRNTFYFSNAYSVSTSTFESLIPAYSENADLRTKYYERSVLEEQECRFLTEAIAQKRHIYFYTDGYQFVESKHIILKDRSQTASEKIWDFLLDAVDEENGLFYIHILYESHFSYPNPYTAEPIVAEGTSIFFDFLECNGGKLRTDYKTQKRDSLQYLCDLLTPFLSHLHCPMVLFADHGNCILEKDSLLEHVKYPQLTFGNELIQIPLAVRSREIGTGSTSNIYSLMDLNGIIVCLLRRERLKIKENDYIKVLRSEIYNEDFKYLYQKLGFEQGLNAFEAFLFQDGWKLVVYANGVTELYSMEDEFVEDDEKKQSRMERIRETITVLGKDGAASDGKLHTN